MRPDILYPLFAPVTSLAGIGPRLSGLVARVAGDRIVDLLWHLPTGLIDRRHMPRLAEAAPGAIATLVVRVVSHQPAPTSRKPYRILCSDETGFIELVFFHAKADYLRQTYPEGKIRVVSGRVEEFQGGKQMTHPDATGRIEELDRLRRVEPTYPLTGGLSQRMLSRAIAGALERAPALAEWIDPGLVAARGWPDWHAALLAAHAPDSAAALSPLTPARQRLAYDELLASQTALLLVRRQQRRLRGHPIPASKRMRAGIVATLPFRLTGSQTQALSEIDADMASPNRMLRLLQGDVGSGKTLVAFLAMLSAVEAGRQAVLMAPTEILARQHFDTIGKLAEAAGIEAVVLTGRDKGAKRRSILEGLATGRIPIVLGTHALFSDDVAFHDLALTVIDEQHRFGVHQRMALSGKGSAPDVLVMTATPIPRTLMLAAYGDLDASQLTEKPPGRQPVDTRALPLERLDDIVPAIERALRDKAQVYWVCPLIDESETGDVAAATERHARLRGVFGDKVGLVHGRMSAADKEAAMLRFATGETAILVATTVIEVGVDVPNATIMVIEHAERFGLAQLHQLRGRVGRGDRRSSCILLYQGPLGETARARLNIMRETDDGFRIAEEDLRLRGGGEILGSRQSGMPEFRLADLAVHGELLEAARQDARLAIERDPELDTERGKALRTLLYLFERDDGVRLLRSG